MSGPSPVSMQSTLSATDVGAVVCCVGSAYLSPVIPVDAGGLLMHIFLATPAAETLRSAIPMPLMLLIARDKHGTTLATSECSVHSKYSCPSAPLLARWLLWQVWLPPRCRSPGGNERDGPVSVYEPGMQK